MKRLREIAWLLAFMILVLPALVSKLEAQQQRFVVAVPNGPTRANPELPWLSQYLQPFVYQVWWRDIADCEHLRLPQGASQAVAFYQVNSDNFWLGAFSQVYAMTLPDDARIYIVGPKAFDKSIVQHEMLHMLAYWNGVDEGEDGHPVARFETCGLHVSYP